MPRKAATATASRASRLFTRRVRFGGGAHYTVRLPGPDGRVVETTQFARWGDEITTDAISIMTLDSVGALAPPGATRQDVEDEQAARIEAYRAARRQAA